MISLYFIERRERDYFLPRVVREYAGKDCAIFKTKNGKPYIQGDPFFISLSHSGDLCSVAVSPIKVGVDTELLRDKNYNAVLLSFPETERKEIKCPRDFFMHWTAREAYVKFCGGTLWSMIKDL